MYYRLYPAVYVCAGMFHVLELLLLWHNLIACIETDFRIGPANSSQAWPHHEYMRFALFSFNVYVFDLFGLSQQT